MKSFLTLFFIFGFTILFSQEKLFVRYEYSTEKDVEKRIENVLKRRPNTSRPEYEAALREALNKKSYYNLRINNSEAEFKKEEDKINNEQPGVGIRITFHNAAGEIIYSNFNEDIFLQPIERMGKNFLINDSLPKYDWKITNETREIMGYQTRRADAVIDSVSTVTAWYAPKLPFKGGPEFYQGLPGLILEIRAETHYKAFGDEADIYRAISIEMDKSKKDFTRPTKGQLVTEDELDAIIEDQIKKMKERQNSGVEKD